MKLAAEAQGGVRRRQHPRVAEVQGGRRGLGEEGPHPALLVVVGLYQRLENFRRFREKAADIMGCRQVKSEPPE
jgi:hypothetical protein